MGVVAPRAVGEGSDWDCAVSPNHASISDNERRRDPHPFTPPYKGEDSAASRLAGRYVSFLRRSISAGLGSFSWKSPVVTSPER